VGLLAFACYWQTLLPGLDFGDTAAFQTGVGSLSLTPRQAYPLYYGLGNIVAWLDPREPAHAMNLASAVYGALAAMVMVMAAGEIAGSLLAGLAAGLFLAFSYTFWTQAIIAEVYTLHALFIGLCLLALLAWERTPTPRRLALFYAVYALGFGNHLSMVLLLPGFAAFILWVRHAGPEKARSVDDPLRPKMLAMALGIACLGALQYSWNFRGLWTVDPPPSGLLDALGKFWFDVTKADWRQTLVNNVSEAGMHNRPALYWFDLRQQFGIPGVCLAIAGLIFVAVRRPRVGMLLSLLYLVNLVFAWTYNVGDVHVFFLPSHYIVALCAGAGVSALKRDPGSLFAGSVEKGSRIPFRVASAAAAAACLLYIVWRGYDTFPAVDRSWDHRPEQVLRKFTMPPNVPTLYSRDAIFGVDANWQVQNAFEYFMKREWPGVPWFTSDDLEWLKLQDVTARFRHFTLANRSAGREVIVTPHFAATLRERGYQLPVNNLDDFERRVSGDRAPEPAFVEQVRGVRPGARYALGILKPDRESPLDMTELAAAWSALTGGSAPLPPLRNYVIVLGEVGHRPVLIDARDRPFRIHAKVDTANFDVRMDSWLPTDTIRRMGFGHVIVNRQHVLTLERGVSFVALGPLDEPSLAAYRSGIFEPLQRLTPWPCQGPTGCRQ
jgi:hypothetical protein